MSTIYEKTEINTTTDADGKITSKETKVSTSVRKNEEPDYIKIYTNMWCEFQNIPQKYRELFYSLVIRMSYANKNNLEASQIVYVIGRNRNAIRQECGWKTDDPLAKGLKILCDFGAIKKVERGVYQINPQYAGKGSWRYNPKLDNGGIEDLIAVFEFKDKAVNTQITYRDSDEREDTVETVTSIIPDPEEP